MDGAAGLAPLLHFYKQLSPQLIEYIQVANTVLDLQTQLDSLADMVLQNRRGLDLLTAGEGGICLFLKEECWSYVNRSGIVKDRIKQL